MRHRQADFAIDGEIKRAKPENKNQWSIQKIIIKTNNDVLLRREKICKILFVTKLLVADYSAYRVPTKGG
jgi:hypothetical protein